MKNILINRTDAIGDTLLTTALARYIKHFDQDTSITMLVSKRSADLLQYCVGIDRHVVFDQSLGAGEQFSAMRTLFKEGRFDYYFHLGGSFVPTFHSFLARVPVRSGILSKIGSYAFLNQGIRQKRSQARHHEMDYNIQFAHVMNLSKQPVTLEDYVPQMILQQDEKRLAIQSGLKNPYVIIHPGMTGHTLNWSMKSYGELIIKMSENLGSYQIVVSHTPSDAPYINQLREYFKSVSFPENRIIDLDGSVQGLSHFAHIMKGASLFLGPSTGTTHMANALSVPQVAIYSPIKVQSSKRWGPARRDENVIVFEPSHESASMDEIAVEDVFDAVSKLLAQAGGDV